MEDTLAVDVVGIVVDIHRVPEDLEGNRKAYPVLVEAYQGSNRVGVADMHLEVALGPRMDSLVRVQMERAPRRDYQHQLGCRKDSPQGLRNQREALDILEGGRSHASWVVDLLFRRRH